MPEFDLSTITWGNPVWMAGGAAALFVVVAAIALRRSGVGGFVTMAFRVAVVMIGAWGVWLFLERGAQTEQAAERRAFEQRNAELSLRAMAPGSALGCLDAMSGDTVDSACEKALFANPESTAAAVQYVAARLALLADGVALARRGESGFDATLATLRLGLETDRFGLVARVLAVRDSCTPLQCDSLAFLKDATRVQANLRDRVFESYVNRYAADWQVRSPKTGAPVAEAAPTLAGSSTAAAGVPLNPKYDFPSASSIPPVSIMTPEPGTPPPAAAASPAKPAATAAVPIPLARRPPPARPARPAAAPPPPVPIGPPPSAANGTSGSAPR